MKYPIGIQDFARIIEDGYVYVDKTALIYRLVTEGKIYFLCRPRRFGKSLLVSTLECYFRGRKELFRGLAIDSLEKEWAQYPVFHIDFNGTNFTQGGALLQKIEAYVASWEREYGKDSVNMTLGDRFAYVLKAAHQQFVNCQPKRYRFCVRDMNLTNEIPVYEKTTDKFKTFMSKNITLYNGN